MRRRLGAAWAAAAVLTAAFCLEVEFAWGGPHVLAAVDDLGAVTADLIAVAASFTRARRVSGRLRWSWYVLGAACSAWATGDAIWAYDELVARRAVPFPSYADIAYLCMPVLAMAGLIVRPSLGGFVSRTRLVIDGTICAVSLTTVSWVTVLGAVYATRSDSTFSFLVSLAYPVTDVALLATAVVMVVRNGGGRSTPLALMVAAMAAMAVSDSAFTYLTSTGSYGGSLLDAGWIASAFLIALAALHDRGEVPAPVPQKPKAPSGAAIVLPYVLAALAIAAVAWRVRNDHGIGPGLAGMLLVVVLVLGRQHLVLRENRLLMGRLHRQAMTDALTGLSNRAALLAGLEAALAEHPRSGCFVFVDLDDFKVVNDSLGHAAGDELLGAAASQLRSCLRDGDLLARLGGDEFAILMPGHADAQALGQRVLDVFAAPVRVAGHAFPLRVSIGVAELGEAGLTASEVMKRGDIAMYAAKRAGKNRAVRFTPDLATYGADELELADAFSVALAGNRIDAAFQPLFDLHRRLIGFETLARWSYQGTPVPPARFLPIAERSGQLAHLDRLMLARVVEALAAWPDDTIQVSCNVSADALADPGLLDDVLGLLDRAAVPTRRLVVEVLERDTLNPAALTTLARLREAGVRIAVDDFGVGLAALSRLRDVRPTTVKVDRSFVAPLDDPQEPSDVMAGIVDLARRLDAYVVAEGVETVRQFERISAIGCDAAQGFLLGRPTPFAAASVLVAELHPFRPRLGPAPVG